MHHRPNALSIRTPDCESWSRGPGLAQMSSRWRPRGLCLGPKIVGFAKNHEAENRRLQVSRPPCVSVPSRTSKPPHDSWEERGLDAGSFRTQRSTLEPGRQVAPSRNFSPASPCARTRHGCGQSVVNAQPRISDAYSIEAPGIRWSNCAVVRFDEHRSRRRPQIVGARCDGGGRRVRKAARCSEDSIGTRGEVAA